MEIQVLAPAHTGEALFYDTEDVESLEFTTPRESLTLHVKFKDGAKGPYWKEVNHG